MLLHESVPAEQLYAVSPDLHALLGTQPPGQRRLPGERKPLGGTRSGPARHELHALELDPDVRDHERHRLAMTDRLAEGLARVHVRRDVVEHRPRRTEGQRTPAEP